VRWIDQGVDEDLALHVASLGTLATAPDIVLVARESGRPAAEVALVYFALSSYFATDHITALARELSVPDYFDRLALSRGLERLAEAQRNLVHQVLDSGSGGAGGLESWVAARKGDLDRTRQAIAEIAADGELTLSKLAVAVSLLGDLVRG
jgi:glutamate dehydrogenase